MKSFLLSLDCPNFIKADVEKAKQKIEEQSNEIKMMMSWLKAVINQSGWN